MKNARVSSLLEEKEQLKEQDIYQLCQILLQLGKQKSSMSESTTSRVGVSSVALMEALSFISGESSFDADAPSCPGHQKF